MLYKSYLVEQNIASLDKNLCLFYGENLGLKNEFNKKLTHHNQNLEIIRLTQEDIVKNNVLYREIVNISLFEKNKVFLISQVNEKILESIKEIESKVEDQKIYLFGDILDKKSKLRNYFEKSEKCGSVPCYADNEMSIKKIIMNRLRGFEGLSTYNVNLIVENTNLDRSILENEFNKIVTFFQNKKIETEKLEELLNVRINDNFNRLRDEALNGNKLRTNKLLSDTIIDDDKNIFYLSIINQRLNKLSEVVGESGNLEKSINELKPPIFWKEKIDFLKQAKKWNTSKIKTILKKTYNLEIVIKSNSMINKNILMKKLLVDICESANAS